MAQWEFGGEIFGHIEDCSGPEGHQGDCISAATLADLSPLAYVADGDYWADSFGLPRDVGPLGIRCGNHPRDMGIRHENVDAVRACYAVSEQLAAEQRAEIYAEAGMSWVAGGGSPEDARYYASVIASGQDWGEHLAGLSE